MIDTELLNVKNKEEEDLLNIKGVTGVGLRNRRIMVYVESKEVASKIPVRIQDIPVSVYVTGKIVTLSRLVSLYSLQSLTEGRNQKWRPAPPGTSIGSLECTAGTFGAVVRDRSTGEPLILSNNHVLAQDYVNSSKGERGKPIVQPGVYDGGSINDRIGALERWKRVESKGNLIDAALAKIDDPSLVTEEVLDVGRIMGTTEAVEDMAIYKSGRTTGLNYGTVIDTHVTVSVKGDGEAEFVDQIFSTKVAEGGDSGSLLCTSINNQPYAAGLLHAGSDEVTVYCKWKNLKELLNVDIGTSSVEPGVPSGWEVAGALIPLGIIGFIIVTY